MLENVWVIAFTVSELLKENQQGIGQPYPPPRLSLRELQFYFMKNLETLPHPLRQFQLTQRKRWITQDSHIENQKLFRICYFLNKIYNKKKKKN